MKQWISLLLAMVLLLACIPVGAMATMRQPWQAFFRMKSSIATITRGR